MEDRDASIVWHMRRCCDEIQSAMERFGDDREAFNADAVYRNAVAMPIWQIGELAKHLTDSFASANHLLPLKLILGTRDWFDRHYMNLDAEVLWEIAHEGIPLLRAFCEAWLKGE